MGSASADPYLLFIINNYLRSAMSHPTPSCVRVRAPLRAIAHVIIYLRTLLYNHAHDNNITYAHVIIHPHTR